MKTILIAAINQIVAQLTGRAVYAVIERAVCAIDAERHLPGEEKRAWALAALSRDDVKSLGTWLINLAIEAVVAKLRSTA